MTQNDRSDLIQRWASGWSHDGDPAILLGVVTDDVTFEDVAVGDLIHGSDASRNLLAEARSAVPDFKVTLQTSVVTETMAAAEYEISGTQTGDLPYLAATGKAFSIRSASVFEIGDGRIRRESRYYDMVQFLSQLGGLDPDTVSRLGTPAPGPGGR